MIAIPMLTNILHSRAMHEQLIAKSISPLRSRTIQLQPETGVLVKAKPHAAKCELVKQPFEYVKTTVFT